MPVVVSLTGACDRADTVALQLQLTDLLDQIEILLASILLFKHHRLAQNLLVLLLRHLLAKRLAGVWQLRRPCLGLEGMQFLLTGDCLIDFIVDGLFNFAPAIVRVVLHGLVHIRQSILIKTADALLLN